MLRNRLSARTDSGLVIKVNTGILLAFFLQFLNVVTRAATDGLRSYKNRTHLTNRRGRALSIYKQVITWQGILTTPHPVTTLR